MKFAHTGDCHLGGWQKQPELAELNLQSFAFFADTCIKEKIDFALIAGDFFDTAYPPIEAIKLAVDNLRRLKEANVPVFIIAGSHDYSASGKSFIEVLEKAGLVKNAFQPEIKNNIIYLNPLIYKGVAVYGYPGKRSGLEVEEIKSIRLHEAPGLFKILMLHTALRDAIGNLPIPAVDHEKLPKADYTALAHLHVKYERAGRVYCGPLFPNNTAEIEELLGGSFYIADTNGKLERREVALKKVMLAEFELSSSGSFFETAREFLETADIENKIVILKPKGVISSESISDLRFNELELIARKRKAYSYLKNLSQLKGSEISFIAESSHEELEENAVLKFREEHPSPHNNKIEPLFHVLVLDKKEEEKSASFEERLFEEFRKVFGA